LKSVIASIIYRSGHTDAKIAFYSYCSKLIDQHYCFFSLSPFRSLLFNLSESLDFKKQDIQYFFISITSEQHQKSSAPSVTMLQQERYVTIFVIAERFSIVECLFFCGETKTGFILGYTLTADDLTKLNSQAEVIIIWKKVP
jgi:hypothetical protein